MSASVRGSTRRGNARPQRRKGGPSCYTEHDIYAAYSEEDKHDVRHVLGDLKQHKLDIYDPHEDALPTATVFKAWLEDGIYKSKISIIFLTKNFVRHDYCRYQADHAVLRYTRTKGTHRVLVVMIQSCKIPKNLHHFNCVYAWKFREEPQEQYKRILKAIFVPRPKFRRGSIQCYGMSVKGTQLGKKTIGDIKGYTESKKEDGFLLKYRHLLFNLGKIKFVLESCELNCTSENCTFKCKGDRILDQFYEHVKVCKYQRLICRYCKQTILRKNHQRHEQTTCRRRRVSCPNESCGRKLAVTEMYKHQRICSYKEETCPNNTYGCTGVFARKDKAKHLEICAYEKVVCERCNSLYFQADIEAHQCERPQRYQNLSMDFIARENEIFQCSFEGCSYTAFKVDIETHQLTCDFRIEQCADCGMRFPQRDLVWHRRQCDKIVECEQCHQLIPSSSKLTHDRWICNGQNIRELCEVCHTCVNIGRKVDHSASCVSDRHVPKVSATAVTSAEGPPTVQNPRIQRTRSYTSPEIGSSASGQGGLTSPNGLAGTSPSFEQLLRDAVTEPMHAGSPPSDLDEADSLSSSYEASQRFRFWTTSKREKWRMLMETIERNQDDFRIATRDLVY